MPGFVRGHVWAAITSSLTVLGGGVRGKRNTGFALLVVHKNLTFNVEFEHLLKTEEGFVELSHIKGPGGAGKVVAKIKKYVVAIGGRGGVRGELHFTGRSLETLFSRGNLQEGRWRRRRGERRKVLCQVCEGQYSSLLVIVSVHIQVAGSVSAKRPSWVAVLSEGGLPRASPDQYRPVGTKSLLGNRNSM